MGGNVKPGTTGKQSEISKKVMEQKMKKAVIYNITLAIAFFHAGCKYAPLVAIMGTPSYHERIVPAEYKLAERKDEKMLVLVDQASGLDTQVNLRYYLTRAINTELNIKLEMPGGSLVSYSELAEFRSNQSDFSQLSAGEIGGAFDANMVLLVTVEEYKLDEMAETGYYKGFLGVRAALLETATEERLWPKSERSKKIEVGFDVERRGQETAVARLASACAFCLVRSLYDCPKNKYRISEDRSTVGWEKWGK